MAPLRCVGKRSLANIQSLPFPTVSSGPPPKQEATALSMSLDSRELRFYASASSSQISRSRVNGNTRESITTTVQTSDGRSFTTFASVITRERQSGNHIESPLYSAGLANLLNSFDAEFKRAFSSNGVSGALFSSLEDAPTPSPSSQQKRRPIDIDLTPEEDELFSLLRQVTKECGMKSTLRVAGGWVRDKILASKEFSYKRDLSVNEECGEGEMKRITSKFKGEKGEKNCKAVRSPYFDRCQPIS